MGTFIDRDQVGNITGFYFCRQHEGQEEVDNGHHDLVAFQRQRQQTRTNLGQQLRAEIDASTTVEELKAILRKVVG